MSRLVLLLSVLLLACAGGEPAPSTAALGAAADEPGATRASRERAREATVTEPPDETQPAAPEPVALEPEPLTLRPVDVDEGEDGHGGVVQAVDPIAFDLDARRFAPRAVDPVLLVGPLRFTRYTHPRVGVLRYVAADRAALPVGAPVAVQFGGDPSVVVSDALELP